MEKEFISCTFENKEEINTILDWKGEVKKLRTRYQDRILKLIQEDLKTLKS